MHLRFTVAEGLACTEREVPTNLRDLILLLEDLQRLPALKGDELIDCLPRLWDEALEKFGEYLKLFEDIQFLYSSLSS